MFVVVHPYLPLLQFEPTRMLLGKVTLAMAGDAVCADVCGLGTIACPEVPSQFSRLFVIGYPVGGGRSGTELGGINGCGQSAEMRNQFQESLRFLSQSRSPVRAADR